MNQTIVSNLYLICGLFNDTAVLIKAFIFFRLTLFNDCSISKQWHKNVQWHQLPIYHSISNGDESLITNKQK